MMSWWPRSEIWEKSSLNVGYWTPYCESWFANRLKSIRDGKFELRNASHWRRSLKQAVDAQRLSKALEEKSKTFLLKEYEIRSV